MRGCGEYFTKTGYKYVIFCQTFTQNKRNFKVASNPRTPHRTPPKDLQLQGYKELTILLHVTNELTQTECTTNLDGRKKKSTLVFKSRSAIKYEFLLQSNQKAN